jgi:hypothetical protein
MTIVDGSVRYEVSEETGVAVDAQAAAARLFTMLDMDVSAEEIDEALTFRRELDGYGVDQVHAAERLCIQMKEALDMLYKKERPLKADLQAFAKTIVEALERSGWEY